MAGETEELVLQIGAKEYSGWEKVSVSRSMEGLAGSFSLDLFQRGADAPLSDLKGGEECKILIVGGPNDVQLLDGYLDTVERSKSSGSSAVAVSGRDRAADLVDCAALTTSNSWTGASLLKICQDLAKPFDIFVEDLADAEGDFVNFGIQANEACFETIERACRMRGVLPLSDRFGHLRLDHATTERVAQVPLILGENLEELSERVNTRDRFSKYIVKGQNSGGGALWGASTTQVKGTAEDKEVTRYRPLIIMAEGKATASSVKKRAAWEAQVRAGRSREYSAKVRGWIQTTDRSSAWHPWEQNLLVDVQAAGWWSGSRRLLITGIEQSKDRGGTFTMLELKHPRTYAKDPTGGFKNE